MVPDLQLPHGYFESPASFLLAPWVFFFSPFLHHLLRFLPGDQIPPLWNIQTFVPLLIWDLHKKGLKMPFNVKGRENTCVF